MTTPTADLILYNGLFWTGDAACPAATAVAISGDRILAVGDEATVRPYRARRTELINLDGRRALPGFIDNHTHLLMGGLQLLTLDLRGTATRQAFAETIARRARALPPGQWVTGGGWDQEEWPDGKLPDKALLDPYTPNHPVFVTRSDLHMAVANSAALTLAGITRTTTDPAGGQLDRDPATGEPTGILRDAAMELVQRVIPPPEEKEYDAALAAALRHAAALGVTSVQDVTAWKDWHDWNAFCRFHARGLLTLRIYARTPLTSWQQQVALRAEGAPADKWLRLGGVKGFVDGSLGSATAYMFEPYCDAPHTAGLLQDEMYPPGSMQERIGAADRAGLSVSVHAIGDRANHLLLDIFAAVMAANGPRDRRFRIEHAQHLRPEDIKRMAALGVIASVQPAHILDDGGWAERRLGAARCRYTYAFRSLLDAGVTVTFGTDWPVAPLSPFLGIYAAVTRRTKDGQYPDGWVPQQKVTVEEAVRAYTVSGAYAEFAEHEKGSLTPGKLADIVVLSQDILAIPPEAIPATRAVYTIVGGKVVYET